MLNKISKIANSLAGYIVPLRQLASFCKGWVGDRSISFFQAQCKKNHTSTACEKLQNDPTNFKIIVGVGSSIPPPPRSTSDSVNYLGLEHYFQFQLADDI